MNRGKWIVLGGVAALVVATLYAPFTVYSGPVPDFRPDDRLVAPGEETSYIEAEIFVLDVPILLMEWGAIVIVTAVLYFVFRARREATR